MANPDEFVWAVKNGESEQVLSALKEDKNRDLANTLFSGRFPLCIAADYGHVDIIDILIKNGANINAKDQYGITPLLSAIYEGHTKCVERLLEQGADKDQKAPEGLSYIDCAEKDDIKQLLK